MKTEGFSIDRLSSFSHPHPKHQFSTASLLQGTDWSAPRKYNSDNSDKDSIWSVGSVRGKRHRNRNYVMKSSKGIVKKSKGMDYTNYAYNEAVGRLKLMLAETSTIPKSGGYFRTYNDDSADNYSDNMSVIERPVLSDISKYLTPGQKSRLSGYRPRRPQYAMLAASKENVSATPAIQSATGLPNPADYKTQVRPVLPTENVQAPAEIYNLLEKQEDYIEQLEKESKFCRTELSHLLGKVKDVINENEQLTEHARMELAALNANEQPTTTPSSDSEDHHYGRMGKKPNTPRQKSKERDAGKEPHKSMSLANAPKIVLEARISELEAELMQANIDLKRLKNENEELKRKLAHSDPLALCTVSKVGSSTINCETHRKQIELLQNDKAAMEDTIRHLQKALDEAKSQQYNMASKRYINDLVQMERSQAELEVKHLRDELDRQHERVRELQHEMARRIAEERANAERRYNTQVDQLGGDLSSQWEQVARLQLELERQKRYETDLKRDLTNRNAQIEELKTELRSNRSTFLADMAQVNAEKQSLEQEITALRLQLDRAARESKTESSRLNAEIVSLRQRLDRGDADLLHSKREVLRLNDEIANLEKELAYGEMKNEIRPTKKDLDKRMSEMQEQHAEQVNELELMIQSQKQLMDKLTNECRVLTRKLEDTSLKHKTEISSLQSNVEYITERMLNNDRLSKLDATPTSYDTLASNKAPLDYKSSTFGTTDALGSHIDDYTKPSSLYDYESILGKSNIDDAASTTPAAATTAASSYDYDISSTKPKYQPSANLSGSPNGSGNNSSSGIPTGAPISAGNNNPIEPHPNNISDVGNGASTSSAMDDYKPSSYKYRLNDIDDENHKDSIGEREKERKPAASTLPRGSLSHHDSAERDDSAKSLSYDYKDYRPSAEPQVEESQLASVQPSDYATDYSGYDTYGQQQYDASAYGGTYDQYDTDYTQAVGGDDYGNYTTSDYDQSAGYAYDSGGQQAAPAPSRPPRQLSTEREPITREEGRTSLTSPPSARSATGAAAPGALNTSTLSPPSSATGGGSGGGGKPATTTASNLSGISAYPTGRPAAGDARTGEGRPQPRASGGLMGPTTPAGSLGSGKSALPQQSTMGAAKK